MKTFVWVSMDAGVLKVENMNMEQSLLRCAANSAAKRFLFNAEVGEHFLIADQQVVVLRGRNARL